SPRHVDLVKPFPVIAASGGPDNFKDQDLQQADDTRCSVVNRDRNEDEFGFRGAEIVCYRPLCFGKASSSSCYTKSHVDTTSTCSSKMTSEMHTHKTVSSHARHNESERIVTPTPKVHYLATTTGSCDALGDTYRKPI